MGLTAENVACFGFKATVEYYTFLRFDGGYS